jgi:hypothetical protein
MSSHDWTPEELAQRQARRRAAKKRKKETQAIIVRQPAEKPLGSKRGHRAHEDERTMQAWYQHR